MEEKKPKASEVLDGLITAVSEASDAETITALRNVLDFAESEADAFYVKGTAAAGTRLRKAMKCFMDTGKTVRKSVSSTKGERKG